MSTIELNVATKTKSGKKEQVSFEGRRPSSLKDVGLHGASASGNQHPVEDGIIDYVHKKTGKSLLTPEEMPVEDIELIVDDYPPIDIYFHEMSAMLGPALIHPSDGTPAAYAKAIAGFSVLDKGGKPAKNGKYAWRYMSISVGNHTNLSYDDTGHFRNAYGETTLPVAMGRVSAKMDARKSREIDDFNRRAVANGITYHTETSYGHYVRNCPHFCWPELKRLQSPAENMVLEMVPWNGAANMTPRSHPEQFVTWAHLDKAGGLPSGAIPRGNSDADKARRVEIAEKYKRSLLRHRRTDFYEHRLSIAETTPDEFGSYWPRRYLSDRTLGPVNMCEFSQYDIRMLAEFESTYGPNEYWHPHYASTDDYKYFMSVPSWNNFQKSVPQPDETREQALRRQWEDLQAYMNACKKGAKPGRAIKIQMRLPPGRYVPKIYGLTRSYSWYPLDLCKIEGDHTTGSPFLLQQPNPTKLYTGEYYPFKNPINWDQAQDVRTNIFLGRGGIDYWKHKGNNAPEYTGSDMWRWPVDEKNVDKNWWDLFKITEGVGDGYMKGNPIWSGYWTAERLKDMNKHYGFGIRASDPLGYSDKKGEGPFDPSPVVPGDIESNDSMGRELPYWFIDITKDKRPKEIHFFAASRAVKWIRCTLQGTVEYRTINYTYGPTDWRHIRIKGPHSLYMQQMARWPGTNYYHIDAVLMPTCPDSLAWIIEVVYNDGSRSAVTIWSKESLIQNDLFTVEGTQSPF